MGGSGVGYVTLEWYSVVLAQAVRVFSFAAVVCAMGKHMDEKTKALCYFYRNPPAGSGVKPQPYSAICKLARAPGKAPLNKMQVYKAVKRFHLKKVTRGRKQGWRKTTAQEDQAIMRSLFKVRRPLGCSVESRDVWNGLPRGLRSKVCLRTVRSRLREKGFAMKEKKAGDDQGDAWRKRRVTFCRDYASRTGAQWKNAVQAVGDFRYFTFFPRRMKRRHTVKSCCRTIMREGERNKPAFLKPRQHIFKRSEYKRCLKAKVFGLTTSNGKCLIARSPLHPTSEDWVKMVQKHVGPFLAGAFPDRRTCRVLLDGETILHTTVAKEAFKQSGIRLLPNWPAHSPDLNPQENVWAWGEKQLRKAEKKTDSFSTFKRRIIATCKQYPAKEKLVPSLADRMRRCLDRRGAAIGK